LLNVGNTRLYQLIGDGELKTYKEGRATRITMRSIRARHALAPRKRDADVMSHRNRHAGANESRVPRAGKRGHADHRFFAMACVANLARCITLRSVIPYASTLADLVPPVAVRLRRDFKTVLTLIRAHALLHQASRQKDADGHIVAEVADYAAIRELVADLVAESAEIAITPEVRETVQAVAELLEDGKEEVNQTDIKKVLKLYKSVVSRRVAAALDAGVLRNLEDRRGKRARLVLGDPLPEEIELLPKPERLHGCTVVEGDNSASQDPRNGSNCAYCGKGALADDPLLDASTDGELFLTHHSCLGREWRARSIAPAQLD
jgi:hypothetical protein